MRRFLNRFACIKAHEEETDEAGEKTCSSDHFKLTSNMRDFDLSKASLAAGVEHNELLEFLLETNARDDHPLRPLTSESDMRRYLEKVLNEALKDKNFPTITKDGTAKVGPPFMFLKERDQINGVVLNLSQARGEAFPLGDTPLALISQKMLEIMWMSVGSDVTEIFQMLIGVAKDEESTFNIFVIPSTELEDMLKRRGVGGICVVTSLPRRREVYESLGFKALVTIVHGEAGVVSEDDVDAADSTSLLFKKL